MRLLEGPAADEVVTDPIVITGRLPADRHGYDWPELYIDRTRVATLGDAIVDRDRFVLILDVPYLTEGAHVLSLGPAADASRPATPGQSRRTFHFWRAPES